MQSTKAHIHLSVFLTGILLVMMGFLFSRAMLSIGTFLLIANGCLQGDWKERQSLLLQQPFLIGISLLFVFPLVSGLWSEDQTVWQQSLITKLPLLFFPFALVVQKGFDRKQFVLLTLIWIALIVGGTGWSVLQYLQQKESFDLLYRYSKVIPTPAANDHIRFSMAIVIALLLWLKLEEWKTIRSAILQWILRLLAIWLVIYLHILGAKTGLLGFYLIIVPLILWQLYTAGKKRLSIIVVLSILILPFLAYQLLPTFKTRVHYVLYDRSNWNAGNLSGDFSDGNRLLSIKSGWFVFQQHWLTGVGYGDIKTETGKWYDQYAAAVPSSERFLPLNQWITSGAGAGILATLLFTVVLLLPFFSKTWRKDKQTIGLLLFFDLIFLYECTIDDQFGVFLFSFFILYAHLTHRIKP